MNEINANVVGYIEHGKRVILTLDNSRYFVDYFVGVFQQDDRFVHAKRSGANKINLVLADDIGFGITPFCVISSIVRCFNEHVVHVK